jgi:hypothetical protein
VVFVGVPQSLAGSGKQVPQLFGVQLESLSGRWLHTHPSMIEREDTGTPFAAHHVRATHFLAVSSREFVCGQADIRLSVRTWGGPARPSAGRYRAMRDLSWRAAGGRGSR